MIAALLMATAVAATPAPVAPVAAEPVTTVAEPDLGAVADAVARCDRATVMPLLGAEGARRMHFLAGAYAEQQQINAARAALIARRQALRVAPASGVASDSEAAIRSASEAIVDRQQQLDDSRTLDGLRREAMDEMRRQFLLGCPASRRAALRRIAGDDGDVSP